MKNLLYIAIIISTLLSPNLVSAQAVDYTIGIPTGSNGGTGYPSPFANWFWGTRQQYLILGSELTAAGATKGDITEIAFNVLNVNSCPPLQGYTVWVKTTSSTPSLLAWETNMGSPVYGPTTYTTTPGWNSFAIPEFSWNGSDNIVIEICSNNSSYLTNGNASVQWTSGLPFNGSRTYYADSPGNCGNTGSSFVTGTTRPIIRVRVEPPFANDANPTLLDRPGAAICDAGKDVAISIQNTGTKNLTSLDIGWQVIRNNNPFPISNYVWTGNLPTNGEENNIQVGNFAPGFLKGDILKFWTSNPNGVIDSLVENDTIYTELREGAQGEYNVGGIFNIDFSTVELAVNFVDSFGAVCDSLIFNVRDGVYEGQFELIDILNTAPSRPIIFRGDKGANSNVTIIDSTLSKGNYLFKINGTNNVYFENIKLVNASNGSNNRVIVVENNSENTHFINCTLENNFSGLDSSSQHSIIYSSNQTLENGLSVIGSTLIGGNYGVYSGGLNPDTTEMDILIDNSVFQNQSLGGVYLENVQNTQIQNSEFTSTSTNLLGTSAISVNKSRGVLTITGNTIGSLLGWPSTGINLNKCQGLPLTNVLIANNFIAVGSSFPTNQIGILSDTSVFVNMYNNSIAVNGNEINSSCISILGGGNNKVVNNNLANFAGGVTLNYQESVGFPIFESNFNNLFTNGINISTYNKASYISLPQWNKAILDDNNSVSVNPNFYSTTDLHTCNPALDNTGKVISAVLKDIDDENRNISHFDIGADEFTSTLKFNIGQDTTICDGEEILLQGNLNFNDNYTAWSTGDSSSQILVSMPGTYTVTSSNFCGSATDTIVISLADFAALGSDTNICANQTLTLNSGVLNASYNWNTGETTSIKNVSEAGIYSVTVTDNNNCITSDTIYVTQSLAVDLPNDTSLCGGKSIFLDPKTGSGIYSWSNGATTSTVLANTSGNYAVTFTDLFGCSSSGSVNVISSSIPNAKFTDSTVAQTTIFTSNYYPNATYLWDFGDGKTSTQQNPVHLFPGPGSYVITLQITNDCGANFYSKEHGVALGVSNLISDKSNVLIFPNPTSEHFNIQNNGENKISEVKIYNTEGRLVLNKVVLSDNMIIKTSGFAKGVYSIELISTNEIINRQLIIQ